MLHADGRAQRRVLDQRVADHAALADRGEGDLAAGVQHALFADDGALADFAAGMDDRVAADGDVGLDVDAGGIEHGHALAHVLYVDAPAHFGVGGGEER